MKKITSILLSFVLVLSLCACGTSKYEKHLSNVEEYISKIKNQDTELTRELNEEGLTLNEDILQKTSASAMEHISDEYETIELEEDRANFLAYIQSHISQDMYDRFSVQIEKDKMCEDFMEVYDSVEE